MDYIDAVNLWIHRVGLVLFVPVLIVLALVLFWRRRS